MKLKMIQNHLASMFSARILRSIAVVIVIFIFSITAGAGKIQATSSQLPPIFPGQYILDPKQSRMSAYVHSTWHDFDTIIPLSKAVLNLPENGELSSVNFRLEFPAAKMKTGNTIRDGVMRNQVLEVETYPLAIFKAKLIQLIRQSGNVWEYQISGALDLHGVENKLEVPIKVRIEKDKIISTSTFSFYLSTHKISPPSLLFVKVDDAVQVNIHLTFHRI